MTGLAGKAAIVTGSSRGIGAATAKALAAEGVRVVVNYLGDAESAAAIVSEIRERGGSAAAVQADVSKPSDIDRLFESTRSLFGRLDILVNNAGPLAAAMLADITPEIIDTMVGQNFKSVALCTQRAAEMFPASGGVVVNLSSETVRNFLPGSAVFASMKAACEVLTQYLAQELGPRRIRVVGVSPGYTRTPATAGLPQDVADRLVTQTALRRPGEAAEIASVVRFLVSDAGSWITGTTVVASGGLNF